MRVDALHVYILTRQVPMTQWKVFTIATLEVLCSSHVTHREGGRGREFVHSNRHLLVYTWQHAVLKPFMLRRVKKDVITEMTSKTEVTMHCKLSSRQQAFYQAIKNKISLAELFDGSRVHLNDKRLLNLMNIVIQLRKVFFCSFTRFSLLKPISCLV